MNFLESFLQVFENKNGSYQDIIPTRVLIINPYSLSEVLLSTPVASSIKLNYSECIVDMMVRDEFKDLLISFCPSVDDVVVYEDHMDVNSYKNFIRNSSYDLIIDLSENGAFSIGHKKNAHYFSINHFVAANESFNDFYQKSEIHLNLTRVPFYSIFEPLTKLYLKSISSICSEFSEPFFPTLFINKDNDYLKIAQKYNIPDKPIILYVAGFNPDYAQRCWLIDAWEYLIEIIDSHYNVAGVLIGFEKEKTSSLTLMNMINSKCVNLVGELDLQEIALVINQSILVVSPDTGLNHLALALGKPVIVLHGNTRSSSRGVYGFEHLTLDQSQHCQCVHLNGCLVSARNLPGSCMNRIMVNEVYDKVCQVLPENLRKDGISQSNTLNI